MRGGEVFFLTLCCRPRNENQLAHDTVAAAVFESVAGLNAAGTWWCRLILLMPDHLHALISFPADASLREVVGRFKAYQARFLNIRWQDNFFDHRLRSNQSRDEKWRYIRANPVRAGLCASADDWLYVWTPPDSGLQVRGER